tara:strand:- start:68 stop:919 length:852 start_codon:yes stop_codon:yes gene_type:complete
MSETGLIVARTVAAMREHVAQWKAEGDLVAVVPTMGALHDGHLALVRAAQRDCSRVIVTIFVNPTQFAEDEDLDAYPRGEAADLEKLQALAADLAFLPGGDQMYPNGFATSVRIEGLTEVLCGLGRPAHFGGVATVVSKLFNQSQADRAYFGEKDYQQSLVVRRMARDLDIPIEIVPVPTVREPDGLAMSSRNMYLSKAQRAVAPVLYRVLCGMAKRMTEGETASAAINWGRAALESAGFDRIEYLEVRNAETLAPIDGAARNARVFVAAHMGETRLIDNVAV